MSEADHYVTLKTIDEYYDNWDEITIYTEEYACHGIVADVDGLEVLYASDKYNDGAGLSNGSGVRTYFSRPYDYIIPVETCTTAQSKHIWEPQNEREQKYAQYQYTYYPGSGKYIAPKYKALTFYCECETGWTDPYARLSRFVYPVPEQFNEINESIVQTYKNMPRQGEGSKKAPWTNINWAYLQLCHLWERGDFPSDNKDKSYLFHINLRATGEFDYSLGTFRATRRAYDRSQIYWYREGTPNEMTKSYLSSNTGLSSWIPYNKDWTVWVVLDGSSPDNADMALKLDAHDQRTYELCGLAGWDFSIKGLDCSDKQASLLIDCVYLIDCRVRNIHSLKCVAINTCDLSGGVFGGMGTCKCFSVTSSMLLYLYDVPHTRSAPYDGSYSEVEKYNASIKGSSPGVVDDTVYARQSAVDCALFEHSFLSFYSWTQKDIQGAYYGLAALDIYAGRIEIISYPKFTKTKQVSLTCGVKGSASVAGVNSHIHELTIEFAPKKFSITEYPYGVSVGVYPNYASVEDLSRLNIDIQITGDTDPNVGKYSCDISTYWNTPHYHVDINTAYIIDKAIRYGIWNTRVIAPEPVSYGMGDDVWGDGHGRWYWCGPTWNTTEYTITADGVLENVSQQKMLDCACVMYKD